MWKRQPAGGESGLGGSPCSGVGGVLRHIDGHVAKDADALFVGIGFQGKPLLKEQVLDEDLQVRLLLQFLLILYTCFGRRSNINEYNYPEFVQILHHFQQKAKMRGGC